MDGEEEVVARIRSAFALHGVRAEKEDADAWRVDSFFPTHITTDVVVEGVDFDRALYPLRYAGHRALAQNLSDLYAVDAEPVGFCWSLAIPASWSIDDVEKFAAGAAKLASAAASPLLGGDLSSTTGPFVCSITAVGRTPGVPLSRSGVRPHQTVWTTRKLGASARGLKILQEKRAGEEEGAFSSFLRSLDDRDRRAVLAHVEPAPFHGFDSLADVAVACIDVSDGLVKDAARLCKRAGMAIDLDGLSSAVDRDAGASDDDALYGGEDWALLLCVPDGLPDPPGCVRVGRVVDGEGVWRDGQRLPERGYDHFQKT